MSSEDTAVVDLVERLRNDGSSWAQPLFNEAASEIDRLRLGAARTEVELASVRKSYWRESGRASRFQWDAFSIRALGELRAAGWAVAVHNDYRLNGKPYTFWLFTHEDGRFIKGEGDRDGLALENCATQAGLDCRYHNTSANRGAEFLLALIAAGAEQAQTNPVTTMEVLLVGFVEQKRGRLKAEAERDALREGLGAILKQPDTHPTMGGRWIDWCKGRIRALLSSPPLGNEGEEGVERPEPAMEGRPNALPADALRPGEREIPWDKEAIARCIYAYVHHLMRVTGTEAQTAYEGAAASIMLLARGRAK